MVSPVPRTPGKEVVNAQAAKVKERLIDFEKTVARNDSPEACIQRLKALEIEMMSFIELACKNRKKPPIIENLLQMPESRELSDQVSIWIVNLLQKAKDEVQKAISQRQNVPIAAAQSLFLAQIDGRNAKTHKLAYTHLEVLEGNYQNALDTFETLKITRADAPEVKKILAFVEKQLEKAPEPVPQALKALQKALKPSEGADRKFTPRPKAAPPQAAQLIGKTEDTLATLKTIINQQPTDEQVEQFVKRLNETEVKPEINAVLQTYETLQTYNREFPLAKVLEAAFGIVASFPAIDPKDEEAMRLFSENLSTLMSSASGMRSIQLILSQNLTLAQVESLLAVLKTVAKDQYLSSSMRERLTDIARQTSALIESKKFDPKSSLTISYWVQVELPEKATAKNLLVDGVRELLSMEKSIDCLFKIADQELADEQFAPFVDALKTINQPDLQKTMAFFLALKPFLNREGGISQSKLFKLVMGDMPSLEALLHKTFSDEEVAALVGRFKDIQNPLLQKIAERFHQLEKVPEAASTRGIIINSLSKMQRLLMAYTIEERVLKPQNVAEEAMAQAAYLKKGADSMRFAPRSLVAADNFMMILLKRKPEEMTNEKILNAEGAAKRVTAAVMIPKALTGAPRLVAQAVGLHPKEQSIPEKDLEALKKEMRLHDELKDGPGIWPLHLFCDYTQTIRDENGNVVQEAPNITAFYEYANGGPLSTLERPTFKQMLQIAKCLFPGLAYIHQKGIAHCDIKRENALYEIDKDGNVVAGWSDFGTSLKEGVEGQVPYESFNFGFYSTTSYTPPELIGNESWGAEFSDFQKADVWALGCTLFRLAIEELPWIGMLSEHEEAVINQNRSKYLDSESFKTFIRNEMEKRMQQLPPENERTPEEQLQALIFRLLDYDPKNRPTMQQATEQLAAIKSP